jgi:hypothetical protein
VKRWLFFVLSLICEKQINIISYQIAFTLLWSLHYVPNASWPSTLITPVSALIIIDFQYRWFHKKLFFALLIMKRKKNASSLALSFKLRMISCKFLLSYWSYAWFPYYLKSMCTYTYIIFSCSCSPMNLPLILVVLCAVILSRLFNLVVSRSHLLLKESWLSPVP